MTDSPNTGGYMDVQEWRSRIAVNEAIINMAASLRLIEAHLDLIVRHLYNDPPPITTPADQGLEAARQEAQAYREAHQE